MILKDILLLITPEDPNLAAVAMAAKLGAANGARVMGLCLTPEPPLAISDCYVEGVVGMQHVLERIGGEMKAAAAAAEGPFREAMLAAGCAADWRVSAPAEPPHDTALRARTMDLVMMAQPRGGFEHALADAVLLTGGAPCLFTPPKAAPAASFPRIAVAWNGSREAKRALDDSLPLLKAAALVEIVTGARGGRAPDRAGALLDHLARHGVRAAVVGLDCDHESPGHALVRWCDQARPDLMVMGAYGRSALTEHGLGGTTRTILSKIAIPVLMSR